MASPTVGHLLGWWLKVGFCSVDSLEEMRAWSDEVDRQIAPLAGHNSPAAVAKVLAAAFTGRTRLCELNSVLASVLERNASDDVITDFKTQTNTLAVRVGESLRAALGGIPAERAVWLQRCMFALAAGMWPIARASATVERKLERPRSHALRPSFGSDLEDSVRALLYGLLVEGWRASGRPVARS